MDRSHSMHSVTQWITKLTDGDQLAAERIFTRYYQRLVATAQRELAKLPPGVADHEGAVNSAMRSFFSAAYAGKFPELDDREALFKLLVTITLRKVSKQYARHYRQKNEGGKQRSPVNESIMEDRQLGPEDICIFRNECQRLLDRLDDDTLKQIALWMMEGYSNSEISKKLDIHIRSVQRKTNLILSMLTEDSE